MDESAIKKIRAIDKKKNMFYMLVSAQISRLNFTKDYIFRNCISMSMKESAIFKFFLLFNQLFRYLWCDKSITPIIRRQKLMNLIHFDIYEFDIARAHKALLAF